MSNFERALAQTLGFEGGVSDHPLDRGGLTKWGITQRAYDRWRVTTGAAKQTVLLCTVDEMRAIYRADYWEPCSCDELPPALARAVFDMAVNSGPAQAKRTLQRSLGVAADGVIGPVTIAAAQQHGNVLAFLKRRGGFIQDAILTRPDQVAFLEGWISRLLDQAWNQ